MKHVAPITKNKTKASTSSEPASKKLKTKLKLKLRVKEKTPSSSKPGDGVVVLHKSRPASPKPMVFDANWKAGTLVAKATPEAKPEQAPAVVVPTYLDLFPWPFEKTRKGIIRRTEWNGLVSDIQKACDKEIEAENNELQNQIKKLLDERDNLRTKYQDMADFVAKFNREFTATYK